ncbi:MAG: hypothetical protein EG823_02375 [Actinobacteria bacterium]|nr:hypothetical protein [Actinomycetota bacterium]
MRAVELMLADIRSDYQTDSDLTRVLLNATSWFEASLAVGLLAESMPARSIVGFANVREAIKELPRCPMPMHVDLESLARIWNLEREDMAWSRSFDGPAGDYSIALLGEGNFLYDVVIRAGGRTLMLMPGNRAEDFINPEVIDLVMEYPEILGSLVDLTTAMSLPFYPMFYMSLEDWQQEYATAVFNEVIAGFDRKRHELPASVLPKPEPKPRSRKPRSRKKKAAPAAA